MPSARSRSLSTKKPSTHRRGKNSTSIHSHNRAQCRAHHYWMVATLVAFPIGLSLATVIGLGPVISFIAGAIGSLLVLLLNIFLEHEFWMFDVHWRARFEDPDFSHRLLVISGALLLMIQTSFLIFFLVDQPFSTKIIRLLVTSRL